MSREKHKAPRRAPKQERSQATLEFLLEATNELVIQLGFEGVTIPLVAQRAGMSAPAIYRYYPTKEALFAAWAEKKWLETITRVVATAVALHERRAPSAEVIGTLVRLVVDMIAEVSVIYRSGKGRAARIDEQRQRLVESSRMLAAMLEQRRAEEPGSVRDGDLTFRCFLVNVMIVETTAAVASSDPERLRTGELHDELVETAIAWLLSRP